MKSPRYENVMPRGGWRYTDPLTGLVHNDNHLGAVLEKTRRGWVANGIEPPPSWKEQVLDEICQQNPDLDCIEVGVVERTLSLDDIWRFAKTAKAWLDGGGKWVPEAESEARAAVCIECPENVVVHGCFGCKGAIKWLAERNGMPAPTKQDEKLQSCKVCGCYNRVAVHMPLEAMDVTGLEFPEKCWKRPSSASD